MERTAPTTRERFRGCLLGLAIGDAVGTTVEFAPRGSFAPVTGMTGGGPFGLEAGQWTDDTSMALCLATSLVEKGAFDATDQMDRYARWAESGYLSSTGQCFDIGNTIAAALRRYRATGEPFAGTTAPNSAGNGCLMRLAPVPMFAFPDAARAEKLAAESARTTHGAAECLDASRLFARMIVRALAGEPREAILLGDAASFTGAPAIVAIARGAYREKDASAIRGSGYVVASLEAALWCFARTDSYRDAVLEAANLGEDADTTAAITGQLAGAHYGEPALPAEWRATLAMRETIASLADRLAARAEGR